MIKDSYKNIGRYFINDHFNLIKKLGDLENIFDCLPAGIKAIPLKYATKNMDSAIFENHQEIIDVHLILQGEEKIGLNDVEKLDATTDYDKEKDFQLFKGASREELILESGDFMVLFPGEAHFTGGAVSSVSNVKKIVFKIPV